MIVHDYEGGRIACAIITPPMGPGYAGTHVPFVPYDGYTGDLTMVSGSVEVIPMGEKQQHIYWSLSNLDTDCAAGAGPNANSCGIHIHEYGTCLAAAGGHYYAPMSDDSEDPWATISYTSDEYGSATGDAHVMTMIDYDDVLGKSMIVHDYSGGRIACAIILPTPCEETSDMCTFAADMSDDMPMDMDMRRRKRRLLFSSLPTVECPRGCEAMAM